MIRIIFFSSYFFIYYKMKYENPAADIIKIIADYRAAADNHKK